MENAAHAKVSYLMGAGQVTRESFMDNMKVGKVEGENPNIGTVVGEGILHLSVNGVRGPRRFSYVFPYTASDLDSFCKRIQSRSE